MVSDITITIPNFERIVHEMGRRVAHLPDACARACANAMNRSMDGAKTELINEGKNAYTAKQGNLRRYMKSIPAQKNRLHARLIISGKKGMSLIHFSPSQKNLPRWKGVSVKSRSPKEGISSQIKRGGERKIYGKYGNKPFIAKTENGVLHLFVRNKSEKLERLFGPSAVQALGRKDIVEKAEQKAIQVFNKRFEHEIDHILLKGK